MKNPNINITGGYYWEHFDICGRQGHGCSGQCGTCAHNDVVDELIAERDNWKAEADHKDKVILQDSIVWDKAVRERDAAVAQEKVLLGDLEMMTSKLDKAGEALHERDERIMELRAFEDEVEGLEAKISAILKRVKPEGVRSAMVSLRYSTQAYDIRAFLYSDIKVIVEGKLEDVDRLDTLNEVAADINAENSGIEHSSWTEV